MIGVRVMGKAKAPGETATVNVVFPKALIQQMDEYATAFMKEHDGMTLRRSDVVRIAVKELLTRAEEKRNGKGAGK
jgi:hypothetical protein